MSATTTTYHVPLEPTREQEARAELMAEFYPSVKVEAIPGRLAVRLVPCHASTDPDTMPEPMPGLAVAVLPSGEDACAMCEARPVWTLGKCEHCFADFRGDD